MMCLRAENVTVRRGNRTILREASLAINPGELAVVLGRNGAGKSTLLSVLAGDLKPDAGSVLLDGRPVHKLGANDLARRRGVLLQEASLQFPFSVEEIVRLGRVPHKTDTDEVESRIVDKALRLCGIQDKRSMVYQKLSGGEKQRVHLARVLAQIEPAANNPTSTYLLLDEPVSALDLYHQVKILETVREMAHNGCGVLVILHDVNLAVRYADRIAFLAEGRIHTAGGPEIVQPALLEEIYDLSMLGVRDSASGELYYVPQLNHQNVSGNLQNQTRHTMENQNRRRLELSAAWKAKKSENPHVRIRDAARELETAEATLVATGLGEEAVLLRSGEWSEMFQSFPGFGKVMALTRNESCVHERKGVYSPASINGTMGVVLGDDIDLRVFLGSWHFAFGLKETMKTGVRHSIQFFDRHGTAIHKIYETPDSHATAFENFIEKFRAIDQGFDFDLPIPPAQEIEPENPNVNASEFLDGWRMLKDTHDFFGLLKKHRVTRTQALRLADGKFSHKFEPSATRDLLSSASGAGMEIMVFVGNPGMIQIHTGKVANIQVMGPWLNVLDPDFNLHLRKDLVSEAWVVTKPTVDGNVTAVELFDSKGTMIVQFFGRRKPGIAENAAWRALALGFATAGSAA
ncbi:MAG: heme ABC transporter ATP-binding protein [Leptospirales bacterium]|nr:heme ABC transporter ATP-binding protein [Leptospirales bacterium]